MTAMCRNCAHYDLEAFRLSSGKMRIVKNNVARCLFDMSRIERKLPSSLQEWRRQTFRDLSRMCPDDGQQCPQFTQREEATA